MRCAHLTLAAKQRGDQRSLCILTTSSPRVAFLPPPKPKIVLFGDLGLDGFRTDVFTAYAGQPRKLLSRLREMHPMLSGCRKSPKRPAIHSWQFTRNLQLFFSARRFVRAQGGKKGCPTFRDVVCKGELIFLAL